MFKKIHFKKNIYKLITQNITNTFTVKKMKKKNKNKNKNYYKLLKKIGAYLTKIEHHCSLKEEDLDKAVLSINNFF